jgi:hypothetical protein
VLIDGRADVARISVSPWNEGLKFQFNPRVGIDAEIGERSKSPFWRGKRFGDRLLMMQIFVRARSPHTNMTAPVRAARSTYVPTLSDRSWMRAVW